MTEAQRLKQIEDKINKKFGTSPEFQKKVEDLLRKPKIFIQVSSQKESQSENVSEEKSTIAKPLTLEQLREIGTYPDYWQPTLRKAAERGESIKETYEELKDFEDFM